MSQYKKNWNVNKMCAMCVCVCIKTLIKINTKELLKRYIFFLCSQVIWPCQCVNGFYSHKLHRRWLPLTLNLAHVCLRVFMRTILPAIIVLELELNTFFSANPFKHINAGMRFAQEWSHSECGMENVLVCIVCVCVWEIDRIGLQLIWCN